MPTKNLISVVVIALAASAYRMTKTGTAATGYQSLFRRSIKAAFNKVVSDKVVSL